MASGTTQNAAPQPAAGRMVAYDRFIEEQLRKTAGGVKSVDIIGGLLTMAAAGVGLLLVAALVDHWVVRGGMGTVSRFLFFLVILGAGVYYFVRHVLPSIIGRINPAYSAYTIERATPSLKNSLLNFLLLRGEREHVPEAVFNTIEEQAARRLTGVPVESTVDRSRILRVGYVLVGLVVLFALYKVLSPKDPFKTAGRVLLPWANITAPSRVTIESVTPGNHTAMRGEQVAIEATVRGLREEERVVLTYSSADGQIVNQTIVLARHGETDNYRGKLPESDAGIHAAIEYRVTAGDAASPLFHIDVVAAPTIVVESIDYDYPKYTGLSNRRAVHEGDIRAIEGTKVTIRARANQPIKAAWIDLDNDGRTDLKMRPQDDQATASMVLALDDEGRSAKHPRYSLRFANSADQRNLAPVEHSIEVIPDLAPEIVILQPQEEQLELPLDGELLIEIQALDPDFALRRVELRGQVGHREVFERRLLDEPRSGQLVGKYVLLPADEQLKVGDLLEFWGVAEDNRTPKPNRAETDRYRVRIIAPENPQDPAQREQRPQQGTDQPGADEPQNPQDDKDQSANGKSKEKSKKSGDKRPNPQGKDPQQKDPTDADRGDDQPDGDERNDPQERGDDPQQDKQEKPQRKKDKQKQDEPNDDPSQSGDEKESQGSEGAEGQGGSKSGEGKQKQGKQGSGKQSENSGKSQADDDQSDDGGEPGHEGSGGKSGKNASRQGSNQSDRNSESGGEPGEPSEGHDGASERNGEPGQDAGARDNVSNDGSDDGAAFEEALKRLQKQDGDKTVKGRPAGNQSANEKDAAEQNSGQDQDAGQKPQPSGQKSGQGAKQPAGQKPSESSDPSGEQKSGTSGDKQPKGGKSGEKRPGQKPTESEQSGEPSSGEQQTGDKQPGEKQPGEKKSGDKQTGDQQTGEEKSGEPDAQQQPGGDKQGAGKQPAKKPTTQPDGKGDQENQDGDSSQSDEPKDPAAGKQTDTGQKPGEGTKQPKPEDGKKESTGEGGNKQPQPKGKPSQSPQQKPGEEEGAGEQAGGDQGQGAQSKQGTPKQPKGKEPKKPNDEKQQRPEAKGGDGQNDKGEPGAGKQGTDDAGSPDPQSDIEQNNDKQQKPSSESTSKEQTKSPAHGKRESNSDGAQGGDKSGGGEQGGGQQAPQRGTGSPGQNTAADEGNGQSTESGEGDTSDKSGDDVESKDGSGMPQQKPGGGKSQSKPPGGKSGEKPGGKSDDQQTPGQKGAGDKQPTDPNARGGQQGEGGPHAGGDVTDGPRERREAPEPGGDAANLDYARKATDLVLERLDNQLRRDEVDQELLDRLGWSKDDLEKFVDRWKKLKQEAQGQGDKATRARQELDESLRSLGLGKRRVQRGAGATSDEQNQLREGVRTSAPSEYADQVNAYKKGLSTVKGKRGGK